MLLLEDEVPQGVVEDEVPQGVVFGPTFFCTVTIKDSVKSERVSTDYWTFQFIKSKKNACT